MKTVSILAILAACSLSGCYAIPVSEAYVAADCYGCASPPPPRSRVYYESPAYVYDYWTPLAFVTGAALGYVLSDRHVHVRHRGHGWGHYSHRRHYRPRGYR